MYAHYLHYLFSLRRYDSCHNALRFLLRLELKSANFHNLASVKFFMLDNVFLKLSKSC